MDRIVPELGGRLGAPVWVSVPLAVESLKLHVVSIPLPADGAAVHPVKPLSNPPFVTTSTCATAGLTIKAANRTIFQGVIVIVFLEKDTIRLKKYIYCVNLS
jgi:hypothetical protein